MKSTLISPNNFRISNDKIIVGNSEFLLSEVKNPKFVAPSFGATGSISFSVPTKKLNFICLSFTESVEEYMKAQFSKIPSSRSIAA